MPSQKDLSSTERLLELIRDNEQPGTIPENPAPSPPVKARKAGKGSFLAKKTISVGVDIGTDELRLVKVKQLSVGQWTLLDCRKVFIESGMSRGAAEFAGFLKAELERFCGPGRDFNLWALIRSDKADVESVRIPKVGKKQIENAVYWTAKKNTTFDEAETILDFEVQGDVVEEGVAKLSVVICTASKGEVEETSGLFNDIGFPLTGLVAPPFALQNLFRSGWASPPDRTAILHIGDDSSRIDVFSGGNLAMTRVIRAGINSMAETLLERYTTYAAFGGIGDDRIGVTNLEPARDRMTIDDAKNLVFSMGFDSSLPREEIDRFGLSREEIFEIVNPALERLVRQVERTIEHLTVILGEAGIHFIYVFSDFGAYRPVVDYVGDQLRVDHDILDPMAPEHPFSSRDMERTSTSQRASLTPALGLALSSLQHTPNLLFTRGEKEKFASIRRGNGIIVSVFTAALLILTAFFFWTLHAVDQKEAALAKLERQARRGTETAEGTARTIVSEIRKNRVVLHEFKERYFGVAVIEELSKLTPREVCLTGLTVSMKGESVAEKAEKPAKNTAAKTVQKGKDAGKEAAESLQNATIIGVVTGDPGSQEAVLASYVFHLKSSPLFGAVTIDRNAMGRFRGGEALHFSITIALSKV